VRLDASGKNPGRVRRAIVIRLVSGLVFIAVSIYAFSRGHGFWNIVYGALGAFVGIGSLVTAAFLIWAGGRMNVEPPAE
jgi:hypothetical protein